MPQVSECRCRRRYGENAAPVFGRHDHTDERQAWLIGRARLMAETSGRQVFPGHAMLDIYRNYAIEGRVQWPIYGNLHSLLRSASGSASLGTSVTSSEGSKR